MASGASWQMGGRLHSRAFLLLLVRLSVLLSTGASGSRELLSGEDHHIYKGTIPRTLALTPHPLLVGTRIVFIHIPKCSGASFQRDSAALMPVGVELKGNLEMTLPLTTTDFDCQWSNCHTKTALFLRHPWRHVLSQFLECKYDDWGRKTTAGTSFPRGDEEVPVDGFDRWATHFLVARDRELRDGSHMDDYRCYNPYNMQSRFLAPAAKTDRIRIRYKGSSRPSLTQARERLRQMDFLGITDFYQASLCLFQFFTSGAMPEHCGCDSNDGPDTHHVHHKVPDHSLEDLPMETVRKLRDLVEVDAILYSHALKRFKAQVEAAEAATGIRVLCQHEIRMVRAEIDELIEQSDKERWFRDHSDLA